MRMSEKYRSNNNSDNPLTSRRKNSRRNVILFFGKKFRISHNLVFLW